MTFSHLQLRLCRLVGLSLILQQAAATLDDHDNADARQKPGMDIPTCIMVKYIGRSLSLAKHIEQAKKEVFEKAESLLSCAGPTAVDWEKTASRTMATIAEK